MPELGKREAKTLVQYPADEMSSLRDLLFRKTNLSRLRTAFQSSPKGERLLSYCLCFLCGLKGERDRVHAVAESCGLRPIGEDVAKVAATAGAMHL